MAPLTRTRVDTCGKRLVAYIEDDAARLSDDELLEEIRTLIDWRAQHAYPLRLTLPSLRNWTAKHSTAGITPAERLKRAPQIVMKLRRHAGMKLSRMQDIAGARAIVTNAAEVEQLRQEIVSHWQPVRISDYRHTPRPTGYRGLHIIVSKRRASDSDEQRLVEIQLRTTTEHRWAETVMHTGNRLGYSLQDAQGPPELVEYFRLASDVLYAASRAENVDPDLDAQFEEVREKVRPFFERT
jgi:ppGpp synthetase/RelA/SpoT-type nucleotidyltranferase